MKIVFYRTLLTKAQNITPSERILFSFLVAKSISRLDGIFDHTGTQLDFDELLSQIELNDGKIELCELNHTKIAKELSQTRMTVYSGLCHLQQLGYIGDGWIFVNNDLLQHGYFELKHAEKLKGELLIFYSYLLDKAKDYEYCLDTRKSKLANVFCKTEIAITKLLHRLYEIGLAQRLDNGKLKILN